VCMVPTLQVDGQRVMAGTLVVHAAAVVVPLHQSQSVSQVQLALAARAGAAEHVKDWQVSGSVGGQIGHVAMLCPLHCFVPPAGRRCAGMCNRAVPWAAMLAP